MFSILIKIGFKISIVFILSSANASNLNRSQSLSFGKGSTHYHSMPYFDALKIYMYSCRKHCEKRRNCLQHAISPFLTMFSTLYGTYFSFQMYFNMSSEICFNLNQSKILSSGNVLNEHHLPFHTKIYI